MISDLSKGEREDFVAERCTNRWNTLLTESHMIIKIYIFTKTITGNVHNIRLYFLLCFAMNRQSAYLEIKLGPLEIAN